MKVTEIRRFLEKERKRLTNQLVLDLNLDSDEDHVINPFKRIMEAASQFTELEQRTVKVRHVRDYLFDIEHALEKVEKGTYGVCDDCGNLIAVERLKIVPQANLCLGCKAKSARTLLKSYNK